VHPTLAEIGVRRGLQWMATWSGGEVAPGLVDAYPLPPEDVFVEISPRDVQRLLGINLSVDEIARLLTPLEFDCKIESGTVTVKAPPFRMDIGQGLIGLADVIEEIARMVGYDQIPETRLADELPPQAGNPQLEKEENLRNLLVALGMQEVITYRMTSPESQGRLLPSGEGDASNGQEAYVHLANPIAPEKRVLRRSLLANVIECLEDNFRLGDPMAFFELGPIFLPSPTGEIPQEKSMLAIGLYGTRQIPAWDGPDSRVMDFFDLKGLIEGLMKSLGLRKVRYEPLADDPRFHPGKCARVLCDGKPVGVLGELHPEVKSRYDLGNAPVLAAEFELTDLLQAEAEFGIQPVSSYPPMHEDIALVVDESIPAGKVEDLIRQTGGSLLIAVRLFDVFRGDQIGTGKKSLAYGLTYQAPDRTLTDKEASQLRGKIVKRLEYEVGAKLRG
jgi:phenylalanyl-tRNA synthetase beta chain